ncbi:MAG: 3-methyl-2-oxobutanoate hydroxymethyltransferase [Vicinamibacterales bacterium]
MTRTQARITDLAEKKRRGEKIAMLTAYDAVMARLFEHAGVDALLVGDSVGMTALGYDTTIPVTIDAMVHHSAAVHRGAPQALIVADLPFLTYQVGVTEAVKHAGRLLQEGGAVAVKLEGGRPVLDVVRRLVDTGIPVMGHLGLLPQSVHQLGGYRRRGTEAVEADAILADAVALEAAGAFAVVLESIPTDLARTVTAHVQIPTIGIGAGPFCDGQILVGYDMLGFSAEPVPPFVKTYARLSEIVDAAARSYVDEVRSGQFPVTPVASRTSSR